MSTTTTTTATRPEPLRVVSVPPRSVYVLTQREGTRQVGISAAPEAFTAALVQAGAVVFARLVAAQVACDELNSYAGPRGYPSYPCFRGHFEAVSVSTTGHAGAPLTLGATIYVAPGHYAVPETEPAGEAPVALTAGV